jgi:hydrogenase expression/formation protein HypC
MCVTYPGRVLEIEGAMATVELDSRRRRASLVVAPEAKVGDWVLVAAGAVLEILGETEARELIEILDTAQHTADTERDTEAVHELV